MSDPINDTLYREVLLDHHRHPHGAEPVERADASLDGKNTSCGDEVHMDLQIDAGQISHISVTSHGCAVSTASGSMLAELIEGRSLDEARRIADVFKAVMHGEDAPQEVDLGDLEALVGVRKFPVRIKCALLPWVTLLDGVIAQAENQQQQTDSTSSAVPHNATKPPAGADHEPRP